MEQANSFVGFSYSFIHQPTLIDVGVACAVYGSWAEPDFNSLEEL